MPLQKITHPSQHLFLYYRPSVADLFCAGALLVLSGVLSAAENAGLQKPHSISLHISNEVGAELKLEVRQAPLAHILKEIAGRTGARIHYSVLPEAPVTATCAGSTVRQIMDCLVARQVGLVAHSPQQDKPAEFWLLGSSAGSCQAVTIETEQQSGPVQASNNAPDASATSGPTPEEKAQVEAMLKQAASKNAEERAGALYNLGLIGQKDDVNIRKALEEAMTDKDANVRTQAITSLMQREGENAAFEVQQALKDKDVNVRLAVIGNVHNDTAILQQALTDSDKMIRDLAASKLKDMAYRQSR